MLEEIFRQMKQMGTGVVSVYRPNNGLIVRVGTPRYDDLSKEAPVYSSLFTPKSQVAVQRELIEQGVGGADDVAVWIMRHCKSTTDAISVVRAWRPEIAKIIEDERLRYYGKLDRPIYHVGFPMLYSVILAWDARALAQYQASDLFRDFTIRKINRWFAGHGENSTMYKDWQACNTDNPIVRKAMMIVEKRQAEISEFVAVATDWTWGKIYNHAMEQWTPELFALVLAWDNVTLAGMPVESALDLVAPEIRGILFGALCKGGHYDITIDWNAANREYIEREIVSAIHGQPIPSDKIPSYIEYDPVLIAECAVRTYYSKRPTITLRAFINRATGKTERLFSRLLAVKEFGWSKNLYTTLLETDEDYIVRLLQIVIPFEIPTDREDLRAIRPATA